MENIGLSLDISNRYSWGSGAASIIESAALDLDLTDPATASQLTTVRAGDAYADNEAGVWSLFSANTPRITDKGLLVEEARTNSLRNNSMQGAVAGTPGTLPTNWAAVSLAGLTQTIVGVGVENGVDYIDIRVNGTTNSTVIGIPFEAALQVAALQTQVWTGSVFLKVTINSGATPAFKIRLQERNSGGTPLVNFDSTNLTVTGNLQRFQHTATLTSATTAFLLPFALMPVTTATAYDFTLRIGWPQLELGAFATSPIRTTTAVVTRAADVVKVADFSWYNAVEGTLFGEGLISNAIGAAAVHSLASISNGTGQELITVRPRFTNQLQGAVVDVNVTQAQFIPALFSPGIPFKQAIACKLNDVGYAANGVLSSDDTVATLPTVDRLELGATAAIAFLNGWLRRVAYWNTRLTNGQLQAITSGSLAPGPLPVLNLNLTRSATALQLTTVRASNAWAEDSAGVYSLFPASIPRITDKGLLVEEARTNGIRNNSMQGVVAGTPGTLPTNWGIAATGMTVEIVGSGTENGIDYIDIRINSPSTTATICNIRFDAVTGIAAATGQTWTESAFLSIRGGSLANVTAALFILQEVTAGGVFIRNNNGGDMRNGLTLGGSNLIRRTFTSALSGGGTVAAVTPYLSFSYNVGVAVDFTLRIGWPQLELGAFPTSPIRTTTVAVTRAADNVMLASFASLGFNAVAGTMFAEVNVPSVQGVQTLAAFDDGTVNEIYCMRVASGAYKGFIVDGNVTQVNMTPAGTLVANTTIRAAMAFAANDAAMVVQGGVPATDVTLTLPTVTRLGLGARIATADPLNGWLRRVTYWNTRLTDARLVLITS